jgi:cytochrome c553
MTSSFPSYSLTTLGPKKPGQVTFNKLENWAKERGQDSKRPDTSAFMQPIVHNLTKAQIEAVAAYLNYLE